MKKKKVVIRGGKGKRTIPPSGHLYSTQQYVQMFDGLNKLKIGGTKIGERWV